jgi:cobyrinic acid a,c-diamide synthase
MTPGFIVAAPHSGAGKTTVTIGLMRALSRRGMAVQAFKCGPDYIDPAFHAAATGRPSYNLDTWAMAPATLGDLVARHSADIAIAEGVMGLFDGVAAAGQTARGATADLAALLGWPVLLVLDVSGQTETAAAVAAGLAHYRDDVTVAGVILNRIASPRHLGLVQADETDDIDRRLDALADAIESAVELAAVQRAVAPANLAAGSVSRRPPGQRIALARDRAFSFMYPHLLEGWRLAGAEILPFSPLADEAPDQGADVVWLPGGYPELHGGVLAAARRFQDGLHLLAARSVPIHGECGGYMVLGQGIEDAEGRRHSMAGLLQVETSFAKRRLHIGYRRARLLAEGPLGSAGETIMGHEFHYAGVLQAGDEPLVDCRDATGAVVPEAGARNGSVSGTFFHAIDGLKT